MKSPRRFWMAVLLTPSLWLAGCGTDEVSPRCDDQLKNGAETGVDCGGGCQVCADGQSCMVHEDCESSLCVGGQCQAPSCADGVKNGLESDIDCGMEGCPPCGDGKACSDGAQCESLVCDGSQCAAAACDDNETNGGETSLNCGGPCLCKDGDPCEDAADCASLSCKENVCAPPTCTDNAWNGDESDIDCGGGTCGGCDTGFVCDTSADCLDGVCSGGICQAPTCVDALLNGSETDVDCGGPDCPPCADGLVCMDPPDCLSKLCDQGICPAPTCSDGVQNGAESDLDCGDAACPCANRLVCDTNDNCASHACVRGKCSVWSLQVGDANHDFGTGVTLDSAGNIYAVGWLNGSGRVAQYTLGGALGWENITNGSGNSRVEVRAVTTLVKSASMQEYVIVAGRYRGVGVGFGCMSPLPDVIDIDPNDGFYPYDGFLAALDRTDGHCLWQRALTSLGVDDDDSIDALAVTANEQIFWTGAFRSEKVQYADAPAQVHTNMGVGTEDIIVGSTNFDGGGGYNWSVSFGGPNSDRGLGIAVDSNDNPVVVGWCAPGTNLGMNGTDCMPGVVSSGAYNGFVARLEKNNGYQVAWSCAHNSPNSGNYYSRAVAVHNGDVLVAGYYPEGAGSLVKYDSSCQSTQAAVGDTNSGRVLTLAAGPNAAVLATFDSHPVKVAGYDFQNDFLTSHLILTWHDYSNLSIIQAAAFGQDGGLCEVPNLINSIEAPLGLVIDPNSDAVVVSGSFVGSVDFGAGPLVAFGQPDAFLTNLGVMPRSTAE